MKYDLYFLCFLGWAYDLKTVSEEMIAKRAARTGDGSNHYSKCIVVGGRETQNSNTNHGLAHHHYHDEQMIWGWDDEDMTLQDKQDALIINK